MFLSGVQFRIRLDSRLKHAGMTVFGRAILAPDQGSPWTQTAEITVNSNRQIFAQPSEGNDLGIRITYEGSKLLPVCRKGKFCNGITQVSQMARILV